MLTKLYIVAASAIMIPYMALVVILSAITPPKLLGVTNVQNPSPSDFPNIPVPGGREILESATWLSRQQISVWFAIVVILILVLVYLIIRFLMKERQSDRDSFRAQLTEQRNSHNEERSRDRESMLKLQEQQQNMQLQLLQYLEKDHQQTVVLLKESNLVMDEVVKLLKDIRQEWHDDKLIAEKMKTQQPPPSSSPVTKP